MNLDFKGGGSSLVSQALGMTKHLLVISKSNSPH